MFVYVYGLITLFKKGHYSQLI